MDALKILDSFPIFSNSFQKLKLKINLDNIQSKIIKNDSSKILNKLYTFKNNIKEKSIKINSDSGNLITTNNSSNANISYHSTNQYSIELYNKNHDEYFDNKSSDSYEISNIKTKIQEKSNVIDTYNLIKKKLMNINFNHLLQQLCYAYNEISQDSCFRYDYYDKEVNFTLYAQKHSYSNFSTLLSLIEIKNPSVSIKEYLARIIYKTNLEISSLIIANMYIDKICEKFSIKLNTGLLFGFLIGCIYISMKLNEDCNLNSEFISKVFGIDAKRIHQIEHAVISLLNFRIIIKEDEFLEYIEVAF